MRVSVSLLGAGLLFCGAAGGVALAADETTVTPEAYKVPSLSVIQPVNPVASKPGAPLITAIGARLGPQLLNVPVENIVPEFHFIAPNGNALVLHREMVINSGNNVAFNPNTAINVPADAQKLGAVVTGGWTCGPGVYYATLRATIMDADGNRSNAVQYTVHCNGG